MKIGNLVIDSIKRFLKISIVFLGFSIIMLFIFFSGVFLGQQEKRKEYGSEAINLDNPKDENANESDTAVLIDKEGLKLKEVTPLSPADTVEAVK